MKKKILLIILACLYCNTNAQEILSTGCITDNVQFNPNFSTETRYTQLDLHLSFEVSDKRAWRSRLNSFLNFSYIFPYNKLYSSCPPEPSSNASYSYNLNVDCILKNSNGEIIVLLEDYLFSEGELVSTANSNYQDIITENLEMLLPENYEVGQYQLIFYFDFQDDINYYDPFEISTSLQTGYFSLGRGLSLDESFQETPLDLASPTIFWEDVPRVTGSTDPTLYYLSVGLAEDSESIASTVLDVPGAIISEIITSGSSYTFDEGVLEPGTEYFARVNYHVGDYFFPGKTFFETRPAKVEYKALSFTVPSSVDNPNNIITPGKSIRFNVEIENELPANLATLYGTLSTETPGVTITDATLNYNNLGAGETAYGQDYLEFIVDESITDYSLIQFDFTLNDEIISGDPWNNHFSIPINPFELNIVVVDDDDNPDSSGDNDDIIEPGEIIELIPTIDNNSPFQINDLSATLSNNEGIIDFINAYQPYNYIGDHLPVEPNSTNILPQYDFVFHYPENQQFQELNFNLELSGEWPGVYNNFTTMKWEIPITFNQGVFPPPVIQTFFPENLAVNINTNSDILLSFNNNISPAQTDKTITIYNSENDEIAFQIYSNDPDINTNGNTVSITNALSELYDNTSYYILIDQGAWVDQNETPFEGISSNESWSFTTALNEPPTVPENVTSTNISQNSITLSWDETTNTESYTITNCNDNNSYTTTENYIDIEELNQDTNYSFNIVANNSIGSSDFTECIDITTLCGHQWGQAVIYPNSMVLIAKVFIDGEPATQEDKVGVFAGEELRAIGDIIIFNEEAYTNITIQGNENQELNFFVWDADQCVNITSFNNLTLVPATTEGSFGNEYIIHADTATVITANICEDESYPFGTNNYNQTGIFSQTLTSSIGLDSIVTLNLTVSPVSYSTDSRNECAPFEWIDGNLYNTNNNTATHTLTNANGCDSIITLNLSILSDNVQDNITSCENYTWIDGVTYSQNNNTASYTLTNNFGCDSVIHLNLELQTINSDIIYLNNALASIEFDASYKWFDCSNNDSEILGATEQTFIPTENGSYAVQINKNNCTKKSDCYNINEIGINENRAKSQLEISPNPNSGEFIIKLDSTVSFVNISVTSLFGQKVFSKSFKNIEIIPISIDCPNGSYIISIYSSLGKSFHHIVIQK